MRRWILTSWKVPELRDLSDASTPGPGVTGLGIDLEYVARFAGSALAPSTAFARQVFSARERRAWNGPAAAASAFTAKEAIAKALGTGLCLRRGPGVPCRDIEVLVDLAARNVAVELRGAAAVQAARLGAEGGSAWCWCDGRVACTIAALFSGNGGSASLDAGLASVRRGIQGDRGIYETGLGLVSGTVPPTSPIRTRASAACGISPYFWRISA